MMVDSNISLLGMTDEKLLPKTSNNYFDLPRADTGRRRIRFFERMSTGGNKGVMKLLVS